MNQSPSLPALEAHETLALVSAATDLSLFTDRHGTVLGVTTHAEADFPIAADGWTGRSWRDLVSLDSQPKVQELLQSAAQGDSPRWRHINFPLGDGPDLPVMCTAMQVGQQGDVVVMARDLRPSAALQQRLVDAQQAMERDYMRLRHLEARYRVLFDMAREAVLLVDAAQLRVVEGNPSALHLVGDAPKRVVGRPVLDCFAPDSQAAVEALLVTVRASGRPDTTQAKLSVGGGELDVTASLFRQESGAHFLLRLTPQESVRPGVARGSGASRESLAMQALESAPDGFVLTDLEGVVLHANAAFLTQTEVPHRDQLVGQSLDRWLGRSGVDLRVLVANLRQRGSVRMFATNLRGLSGAQTQVEISGVAVQHGDMPCLGFMVRDIGRRLTEAPTGGRELPRSVTQLTELVGRVPLKRIVSETTDLIEQLCIEAALQLAQDNRASAAEMLGLSRQSLYVKLRRFGMIDAAAADDNDTP